MIETRGLKNVVNFIQTISSFVLSRKIINMNKHSSQCQKCAEVMCEKHLTQICLDCLEGERIDNTLPCKYLVLFCK